MSDCLTLTLTLDPLFDDFGDCYHTVEVMEAILADSIIKNSVNADPLLLLQIHEQDVKGSKVNEDYIVSKRILAEEKFIPKIKPYYFNNFTNISEEKSFLKKLEKTYPFQFPSLIKLIHLYTLSIISKN